MLIGSFTGVEFGEFGAALTGAGARLQAALVVLGKIVGNSTLTAVQVDGAPGAKTATAAALAFTKYVAGAPAAYKKLTTAQVKAKATILATALEAEIRKRGGQPTAPTMVASAQGVTAKKAAPKVAAAKKKVAVAKKAVAKKAAGTAAKKAAIAKANARQLRAQAAALRLKAKKATPAEAARLTAAVADIEQMAVTSERIAVTGEQESAAYTREAAAPEGRPLPPPPPPAPPPPGYEMPEGAAMAPAAAMAPSAAMPTAPEAGPTAPEAMPGEGFFARNKIALGVGAVALIGTTAFLIHKKKKVS
jgi:DNA-binding protein HU-beta